MEKLRFNFEATGIGSVPFKDPLDACRLIFETFPEIPFWPQLPKVSFRENMYVQYSEHIPGVILDEGAKTIHINTKKAYDEIEAVYSKCIENDVEFFGISAQYARGLHEFLKILASGGGSGLKFVKGQITGPISFALSLTDENKRSVIYDKDLFEVIAKVLTMNAKWQIMKIKESFPNAIIFIDEPYLVSIGTSYVSVDKKIVTEKLSELSSAIKDAGALSAIHCCGNTDWSMVLESGIDILNFDAYNFTKEFLLYPGDIAGFLGKGGSVAWGMVPSGAEVISESPDNLKARLKGAIKELAAKGIAKDGISSIVTPSCGVGSLDDDIAKKVFRSTKALSDILKKD